MKAVVAAPPLSTRGSGEPTLITQTVMRRQRRGRKGGTFNLPDHIKFSFLGISMEKNGKF